MLSRGVCSACAMPSPDVMTFTPPGRRTDSYAEAVVVHDFALEKPRHRLQADVRMGRHVHRLARR